MLAVSAFIMKRFMTASIYVALAVVVGAIARSHFAAKTATREGSGDVAAAIPEKHRVTVAMLAAAEKSEGQGTSSFRAPTADGTICTLADLAMSRPLVLVFIKDGCPCSEAAQPFLNRLHELYGAGAQFAGVIDADAAAARRWAAANRVAFPLLLDPELEVVRRYGAENSAYVALIGRGGKVLKAWPGYSADMLRELGRRLAEMTGAPERLLALADAPQEMYSGCPY